MARREWFAAGVNVAWYNWAGDFGGGTSNGVRSSGTQTALHDRFGQMQDAGVHVARWWVFPGNPWQIAFDGSGRASELDASIYGDFDAALALAEQYDLYYVFVLFSGPEVLPGNWQNSASDRQAIADTLAPLFARYSGNSRILAWEIYNEPEFRIWDGTVQQAPTVDLASRISDAVHANSTAGVTVGSAMLDGLGMWTGIGLDFYQAHWCARCTDYAEVRDRFGLDAPLVIGEWFGASSVDALDRWEDWYDKGYAGAWPWTIFPERTNDHMSIDMGAMGTFAVSRADVGPSAP